VRYEFLFLKTWMHVVLRQTKEKKTDNENASNEPQSVVTQSNELQSFVTQTRLDFATELVHLVYVHAFLP